MLGLAGMEIQPVCVILSHTLLKENRIKISAPSPPYIDFLEQLTTQGYELCALRMSWLQADQAETSYNLIGGRSSNRSVTVSLSFTIALSL